MTSHRIFIKRIPILLTASALALPLLAGQTSGGIRRLDGTVASGSDLDSVLDCALATPGIAAVAVAVIQDGRIVYDRAAGFLIAGSKVTATRQTVFRAASLSKPVFAYLALKLADEMVLDLDRPLYQYLSRPLPEYPDYADLADEPRYRQITARMALSHTTGLPNWRWQTKDGKLKILFDPGTRFSYSGEGYRYLQFVIESLTRKGLDELAREKVFVPLAMERSSFIWQPQFEGRIALDLEGIPPAIQHKIRTEANAAGSLLTTATDYARFLLAAMDGRGLRQGTHAGMLKPQIEISTPSLFGTDGSEGSHDSGRGGLAWALGWGILRGAGTHACFHVGVEPGCENYVAYFVDRKTGYVLLSSGGEYGGVARYMAPRLIGDSVSPFDWLGY